MSGRRSRVNIEEVFVGLRRAWHPPSVAIETSFTRLTQTLAAVFDELRADGDLAGLHGEIYKDFEGLPPAVKLTAAQMRAGELASDLPAAEASDPTTPPPEDGREAELGRKGFYICNSLIQLMEDVYLDLQLETDYRHPDNRGWMNLFRHWSGSDTFRKTWAVSASTYGLRFQDFCGRRLGLSLGSTDLMNIWDRTYSPLKTPPEHHPFDHPGARGFDNTERRLIEILRSANVRGVDNPIAERIEQVLIARLVVPSNRTAESQEIGSRALRPDERENLLILNYGIVFVTREGELLTLRVRRHLREQGLGRRLMGDLVERLGVRSTNLPESGELGQIGIPGGSRERIQNLFRSVLNESDLELLRLGKAGEVPAEPVFGTLPPLPYSGVVRPPRATWAHAVAFCYWVLAGADNETSEEQGPPDRKSKAAMEAEARATMSALSHWAGDDVEQSETDSIALEARDWYQSAKRPPLALLPEILTITGQLLERPWFDEERKFRLAKGFEIVAKADDEISAVERDLLALMKDRLGLQLLDEDSKAALYGRLELDRE